MKTLAEVPILVMVGDHLGPQQACAKEIEQVNAAGGNMTFISLPRIGMKGNSHMFMEDRNNREIADYIVSWIDQHVEKGR